MRLIARILLAGCLSLPALAAPHKSTETLLTRPGVTERFLLITPDHPLASLILFAGGDGDLDIKSNGDIGGEAENFLVRTRDMWAAQGFQVAVVDTPSDNADRESDNYALDMHAVADFLKKKSDRPIWLMGTSRGTTSAASIAVKFANEKTFSGLVLTSSIVKGDGSVTGFDLSRIKVPVLIVHHREDGCRVTPYGAASDLPGLFTSASAKELITIEGGHDTGKPCKAMAYHGYNGAEDVVVSKVSNWIKAHPSR